MANSVDPDQSDLGQYCLPRPVCQKIKDHYSTAKQKKHTNNLPNRPVTFDLYSQSLSTALLA